jgi:hypothetical protein
MSRCSFPQPSHKVFGTSHRKTWPSKNMHADGINRPSSSCIPSLVIELTWTGGGFTSARMLVNELSYLAGLTQMLRECELAIRGLRGFRSKEENSLSGSLLAAHWRERGRTNLNLKDMWSVRERKSEFLCQHVIF